MKQVNELKLQIDARSINESYMRVAVSAFAAQLDPTVEEINDIKTAVSEAVTNCIVHAYKDRRGKIYISVKVFECGTIEIKIRDKGCGIENVKKAREPLFTTGSEDRAGLGFSVMESFMDKIRVNSRVGVGTTVTLIKNIKGRSADNAA